MRGVRLRFFDRFRANPRRGPANSDQAAWFSPRVIEGERPRWIFRSDPINEFDSGWAFIEGSESDEWLNEEGHCVMQHLGHIVEQWPDLTPVLRDDRTRSAWEWNPDSCRYDEVAHWQKRE